MGYNIEDVGGQTTDVGGNWNATLDLTVSGATTVSGDFQVISVFGTDLGEATNGYSFSALSNPTLGTLVSNATTGTFTFTVNWAAVKATGSDQVISFTVTGTSGTNTDTDIVTINLLICVARGTMIDTVKGQIAVEDLVRGDLVTTMDGDPKPVRWVGSRKVTGAELQADPTLRPVRISRNALGKGMPRNDLLVSPQHRIFLQDWRAQLMFGEEQVLVPAKGLINDQTIRSDRDRDEIEYFHILFDEHQIIYTEGLATESFQPGKYTISELSEPVRDELFRLFPKLQQTGTYSDAARPSLRPWEARMLHGAVLE